MTRLALFSLVQPQKGLRNLVFLFVISIICLTVSVNTEKTGMANYFKSLWQTITGALGQRVTGPRYTFPDSLEGFGYEFNQNGELRDKNGGRFQFVVHKDDPEYNQQHYNALGEVVTEHLYSVMERDLKLEKVYVPVDAQKDEPQSFIFRSKDAAVNERLMVLIHGSGAVRAGQWSRRLIINENINTGSQLPYIRQAINLGFSVIVMNPNLNEATVNGKLQKIKGSENPENHGVYVWQHFVQPAKAQSIALVAHSYGGIVACTVAGKFLKDFQKRVFSVVYTDSVHMEGRAFWDKAVKAFMKERAVNFVSSDLTLNTKVETERPDACLSVSAGTPEHERTSHSCMDSAFQFIKSNYATWIRNGSMASHPYFLLQEKKKIKSEL